MKSIQGLWGWIWRSVGKARFSMIGWRVVSLTAFFAEVCRLKYALVTLWMLLVGPAGHCLGDGIWQDLAAWKAVWPRNPVLCRLAHTRFLKPEHFMKSVLSLCGWIGKLGLAC